MLSGKGIDLLNILIERKTNKNSTTAPTLDSKVYSCETESLASLDRFMYMNREKKIEDLFSEITNILIILKNYC
jgi:hypothetical protein